MNNRNTVGEAIFIRDTRTFPAPEDDDPLPGSLRLADASGNWAQSLPSGPMPAAAQSAAAASIPVAAGTAGGAIALSRAGTIASGTGGAGLLGELAAGARLALRRFGAFGIASTAYELGQRENQRAWNAPEDYMEQEALRYGGVDGFDSRQMEIYDNAVERLRAGTAQGHVRGDFYQQMDSYRHQRKTAMLLSSSVRVADNVRVDEDEERPRCPIKRITFDIHGDPVEFSRQIEEQQERLNRMPVSDYMQRRAPIAPGAPGRAAELARRRRASRPHQARARRRYEEQNEEWYVDLHGKKAWNDHLSSLAATHELDLIAGGYEHEISGMGGAAENSSIGPQWTADRRGGALDRHAAELARNGCPMMRVDLVAQ